MPLVIVRELLEVPNEHTTIEFFVCGFEFVEDVDV